ncbi:MAG: SDR family NAD(P)-dependent oxidoreductase [Oligoflexales bacterium]|nr:SDR family NAD(P)-dependent oxidoreductase [Oligoflexales bacterium]
MTKKTIFITGAARGIGFAAAKLLQADGHQVIASSRDLKKLEASLAKLPSGIAAIGLDVCDEKQVKAAAQEVQKRFGTIDVIINNAGSVFDEKSRFQAQPENPFDSSLEALKKTYQLNIAGPYAVIKYFLPLLSKNRRTDIINVSSGMGALKDMGPGCPTYRISKVALNAMTVTLSAELIETQTHVNSICPGWCATDLGGVDAPRTPEQGVEGMQWIINEEPKIRGKFIRDKEIIDF